MTLDGSIVLVVHVLVHTVNLLAVSTTHHLDTAPCIVQEWQTLSKVNDMSGQIRTIPQQILLKKYLVARQLNLKFHRVDFT